MKKSLLSIVACLAIAFCSFATAATDSFKPTGVNLQTVSSQAQATTTVTATVAIASESAIVPANPVADMKRSHVDGAAVAADVRTGLSAKQVGIQADRGAEGRAALLG